MVPLPSHKIPHACGSLSYHCLISCLAFLCISAFFFILLARAVFNYYLCCRCVCKRFCFHARPLETNIPILAFLFHHVFCFCHGLSFFALCFLAICLWVQMRGLTAALQFCPSGLNRSSDGRYWGLQGTLNCWF
ncbi:hypothetical protein DFH27DRAFT_308035 [Peziza echinospora]|nr:hypothetical protein DFH27DRAFT_308035 [Peziza echinospora]